MSKLNELVDKSYKLVDEFEDLNIGVKAIGTTPMRPRTDGIGLEGVTVNFGNIITEPGEYVYADADGVIVLAEPDHG